MKITQMLAVGTVVLVVGLSAGTAAAQGRGNFDPEQMRARMMERYKEALAVNSDAEWKVIETRLQKVMDARRDVGFGGGRAFFGRRQGGDQGGGDRQRPGSETFPEAEALQKAIDAKAPADELKAKLTAFREARQKKQAALEATRAELKKVLSLRQEAVLVGMGVLE